MESTLLRAEQLKAGYGSITVVHGIDLEVMPGEVVALLGANGAGKTTTLLTLAGDIPALGGRVIINGKPTRGLTTEENLKVGKGDIDVAIELFPGPRCAWSPSLAATCGADRPGRRPIKSRGLR